MRIIALQKGRKSGIKARWFLADFGNFGELKTYESGFTFFSKIARKTRLNRKKHRKITKKKLGLSKKRYMVIYSYFIRNFVLKGRFY